MSDLKVPPNNIEAEEAVLGAMLTSQDAALSALEILNKEDFYHPQHQIIFQAIYELERRSQPVDIVTVTDYLVKAGLIEKTGGADYITELIDKVPAYNNVEYYAKIVKEKAILRELIKAGNEISQLSFEGTDEKKVDIEALLDLAEQKIFRISQKKSHKDFLKISELVFETFETLENMYNNPEIVTGVPSGFKDLDQMTAGFHETELIVIAGRPGMGKTAFCLNIAAHVAFEKKLSVAIFNLEMSANQLVQRFLAQESGVNIKRLQTGKISQKDWANLQEAASKIYKAEIFIDDTANLNVMEIRAKCRKLKAQHNNLALIIIDYLQLINSPVKESRQQQITEISRGLKLLAKELNIPVIVLSQLNREVEKRVDKRPLMSDLRESGSIEQDADLVIMLYRDEYYKKEHSKEPGVVEVIIAKQRNGPQGTIKLTFKADSTKFENYINPIMY